MIEESADVANPASESFSVAQRAFRNTGLSVTIADRQNQRECGLRAFNLA
jgi:hypothetical protein